MEDTYSVVIPDATGPAGGDLHSLFGVFDGHGGKVDSSFFSISSPRSYGTCCVRVACVRVLTRLSLLQKVSQFLKDNLLPAIVEAYAQEKAAEEDDPDQRTPAERLQAILPRTFLRIDERAMADDQLSGSTAVVAILTENDIVVANVGDSRGIIYRSNEAAGQHMRESGDSGYDSSNDASLHSTASEDDATEDATDEENDTDTDEDLDDAVASAKGAKKQQQQKQKPDGSQKKKKRKYKKKPEEGPVGKIGRWQALSVDHKPNRPDERERVEHCGGRVTKRTNDVWRFQSVLAVSRAFGDHGLKVGAGGSALTANPEIKIFTRQENDKFFVLARYGHAHTTPHTQHRMHTTSHAWNSLPPLFCNHQ
jgi:serine/threonine protein phosphatase PrpC